LADVFTKSSAGTGSLTTNQVLTAYQRVAFFALREDPIFDPFAKVKPGNLTSPGDVVTFTFWTDMTANTTALNETTDVDAVALGDSTVSVTPQEHGNAVLLTIKIRTDDMLIGFDADVANLLAFNMVDSLEKIVVAAIDGGSATNIEFVGDTTASGVVASDILTAALVRKKRAQLRGASVMPWDASKYAAVLHPDTLYDLKSETGDDAWLGPAIRQEGGNRVWNDEIGSFAGFRFMETARATIHTDGASSAVDEYHSYFFGREFLAKAESISPSIVMGPVTDKLRRFQPLGWYFYSGWDTFREAALRQVRSASSIGSNT